MDLLKGWLDHPKLLTNKELNKRVLSLTKALANSRNEILHSHLKHYDTATQMVTSRIFNSWATTSFMRASAS